MVSKTKAKIFLASLAILGCSKDPQVCSVDANASVSEVDASDVAPLSQDTSSTVDLSKDSSSSQEN